jgi:hypothetical protein
VFFYFFFLQVFLCGNECLRPKQEKKGTKLSPIFLLLRMIQQIIYIQNRFLTDSFENKSLIVEPRFSTKKGLWRYCKNISHAKKNVPGSEIGDSEEKKIHSESIGGWVKKMFTQSRTKIWPRLCNAIFLFNCILYKSCSLTKNFL